MTREIRDAAFNIDFDAAKPLWQRVVDLGESLPPEAWDHVHSDLAANLDHYLYGSASEAE